MERKVHPRQWTYENIAAMRAQLKRWGCRSTGAARSRPATRPTTGTSRRCSSISCAPAWSSASKSKVNWDPVDKTVLANEQVIDGRGWRSGARGRAARADPVVLQDHRLFARAARRARHARALAGEGAADAGELDRPLRGAAGPLRARSEDDAARRERARGLHHAARHAVRREVHGARARPSARQPRRRRRIRSSPHSSTNASTAAPRRPRSRPPRSWASTPASRRSIRSTRRGSCRSRSPISC